MKKVPQKAHTMSGIDSLI